MTFFRKQLIFWGAALLWIFTANAEPQVVHLQKGDKHLTVFGTIHVAKPDFYPLPNAITDSLAASDALAVEVDVTDPNIINETMQLMMTGMQSGGARLDAARLKQLEALIGPMAAAFKDMPAAFAGITAAMMRAEQLGYTEIGVDMTLINRAKSLKKPVISLETPAEQLGAFSGIPDKEAYLVFDSAFSEKGAKEIHQTEQLWKTGDTAIAQNFIQQTQADTPHLFQQLVIDRNRTMVKRAVDYNQRYPKLFIAIGALHLYGEGSVIELLTEQGYREIN